MKTRVAPANEVQATGFPAIPAKPGLLRGRVDLSLHTLAATRLVHGRTGDDNRRAIIGLFGFADRVKKVWKGARQDDPYADWTLLRIDALLSNTRQAIASACQSLAQSLAEDALQAPVWAATQPFRIALVFETPYAYRAAALLWDYDNLARTIHTAHAVGLIDTPTRIRSLRQQGRRLRRLFQEPCTYRATGLTRSWVSVNPLAVCQAQTRMGPLPADILSNERRPAFTPFRAGDPDAAERQGIAHYHQEPSLDPQNHDSGGSGL